MAKDRVRSWLLNLQMMQLREIRQQASTCKVFTSDNVIRTSAVSEADDVYSYVSPIRILQPDMYHVRGKNTHCKGE